MALGYFIFKIKSFNGFRIFSVFPYPFKTKPLEARGASSSIFIFERMKIKPSRKQKIREEVKYFLCFFFMLY